LFSDLKEKYKTYIGIGLQRDPGDFSRSHCGNYSEFTFLDKGKFQGVIQQRLDKIMPATRQSSAFVKKHLGFANANRVVASEWRHKSANAAICALCRLQSEPGEWEWEWHVFLWSHQSLIINFSHNFGDFST